jgi:oligopeptide/dipeptide ABC transporter ATP-binding protein
VSNPSLVVCDEPVSALDVSLQAEIVNLLRELQDELGLTYLFITHDITLLPHLADDVAVQYLGVLVEKGPAREILTTPRHPYTAGLLDSVPSLSRRDGSDGQRRIKGEIPDPLHPPSGCRFRTRCPYVVDRCASEVPAWRSVEIGRWVACHRAEELTATLAPGSAAIGSVSG